MTLVHAVLLIVTGALLALWWVVFLLKGRRQ